MKNLRIAISATMKLVWVLTVFVTGQAFAASVSPTLTSAYSSYRYLRIIGDDDISPITLTDEQFFDMAGSDVFPVGTVVEIRTLEGDVQVRVEKQKYLMIGIEGEVYPIAKKTFEKSYKRLGGAYNETFEYSPTVKNMQTGEKKQVAPYAETVISTGQTAIYARELTTCVKLFTAWDEEKYYSGEPGDYIAFREDDPHDIYVIRRHLFDRLYQSADL